MEPKLTSKPNGDYCPVRATLALLGQKWVPHIVYQLMDGKLRFNELATEVGGCNSRTLRDRLKALEELGIVSRHIVATMPPWVEYELTERGADLGRALQPLAAWGRAHLDSAELATRVLSASAGDR
jgi:DNA-binding HxlR family transcriptional regulator